MAGSRGGATVSSAPVAAISTSGRFLSLVILDNHGDPRSLDRECIKTDVALSVREDEGCLDICGELSVKEVLPFRLRLSRLGGQSEELVLKSLKVHTRLYIKSLELAIGGLLLIVVVVLVPKMGYESLVGLDKVGVRVLKVRLQTVAGFTA